MDPTPTVKSQFSTFPDIEVKETSSATAGTVSSFHPGNAGSLTGEDYEPWKMSTALSVSFHLHEGNLLQRSSLPPLQKLLCSIGEKWKVSSREIPSSRTAVWVKLTKKITGRNKVEGELVWADFWSGTKNSTRIRCSALILPFLNAWLLRLNVVLKLGLHEIDKHNYLVLLQSII